LNRFHAQPSSHNSLQQVGKIETGYRHAFLP
jgi:hypothetical protein